MPFTTWEGVVGLDDALRGVAEGAVAHQQAEARRLRDSPLWSAENLVEARPRDCPMRSSGRFHAVPLIDRPSEMLGVDVG